MIMNMIHKKLFFPVLSIWVILEVFILSCKHITENIWHWQRWELRKEVNFQPVSFEIQLPEMTLKPIRIVDRNVVRQAEFCIPTLRIWFC